MTAPTLRALWRARRRSTRASGATRRARLLFLHILQQPRGIVHEFRRMNQYGILGRYLPEFGRIVGQMQHDLFHVYTVDQHILMVLRNLRRFTMPEFAHEFPLCSELMSGFERPWLLYVAALFHDIAKGRGGDHSDARRQRRQEFLPEGTACPPRTRDLVAFLVEHHLAMSAVAQKQDVHDPEVMRAFAERVGDRAPPDRALPAHRRRRARHQPEGVERLESQAARGPVPRHAPRAHRRAAGARRRAGREAGRSRAPAAPLRPVRRRSRTGSGRSSTPPTSCATTRRRSPGRRAPSTTGSTPTSRWSRRASRRSAKACR